MGGFEQHEPRGLLSFCSCAGISGSNNIARNRMSALRLLVKGHCSAAAGYARCSIVNLKERCSCHAEPCQQFVQARTTLKVTTVRLRTALLLSSENQSAQSSKSQTKKSFLRFFSLPPQMRQSAPGDVIRAVIQSRSLLTLSVFPLVRLSPSARRTEE